MTARTRVNLSAAVLLDAVGGVIAAEPETILCDPELQGSGFSLQCVTPGKKDRHFAAKLRRVDFPARSRSSGQGADARFGAASWKVIPVPAEPPAATLLLRK